MTILVTGVTGQVGGALVPVCGKLGPTVAADRSILDLSKPDDLGRVLNGLAPSLIINAGAYTAVDKAEAESDLAFRINAAAPGAMARWAATHDVPMVHFSTDYVFDGTGETPWRETDRTQPLSVYGRSKLAGEDEVRAAGGASLIVRISWIYAATGRNFLTTMARLCAERPELRVVADQFGAPTSAAFVAAAVGAMVGSDPGAFRQRCREAHGLVHLAAGGVTTWHAFASEILNGLRERGVAVAAERVLPITTADYPTPARRPHNSRLDLQRLKSVFGIAPPPWTSLLGEELDKFAAQQLRQAAKPAEP